MLGKIRNQPYFPDRIAAMPISVAQSPLELIGNTPVVRLNRIPGKDDAEVWAKLENFNPGGSVKDRICLAMVEAAEKSGRLTPDPRGMHGAIAKAEELCRENPGYFMPQQFSNAANPDIHYRSTGPELLEQLPRLDAFISAVV